VSIQECQIEQVPAESAARRFVQSLPDGSVQSGVGNVDVFREGRGDAGQYHR
jgi:hypothetical protein